MRLVIVESPYAPQTPEYTGEHVNLPHAECPGCSNNGIRLAEAARNKRYAIAAMLDAIARGDAPMASHVLLAASGVLNDSKPEERALGIKIGLAWGAKADLTAVYVDLGWSGGMRLGVERAQEEGRAVEVRTVPGWLEAERAAGFATRRTP